MAPLHSWRPLSSILFGVVVYPFHPNETLSPDSNSPNPHQVALEVGDEVYCFEQCSLATNEDPSEPVLWYRGYVVSTGRQPPLPVVSSSEPFSSAPDTRLQDEPQVYVGIFPAIHTQIREALEDGERRLAALTEQSKNSNPQSSNPAHNSSLSFANTSSLSSKNTQMAPLLEEDEESEPSPVHNTHIRNPSISSTSFPVPPMTINPVNAAAAATANQSSTNPPLSSSSSIANRPPPPLPSLKCGDETAAGISEPLIDEISCALREWASLLYTHLYRREYQLFHTVRNYIDQLHSARRQLLANALSVDELARLREECVDTLVRCNLAQGLDLIVRHPTSGALVDVEANESDLHKKAWVSGVSMFAMQVAIAFPHPIESKKPVLSASTPTTPFISPSSPLSPLKSPTSTFEEPFSKFSSSSSPSVQQQTLTTPARFHHVHIELRAFVATPCSPGETSELTFSIYNKAESRFLTEEFAVILNHQGVPLSEGRLGQVRTLFKDLSAHDIGDQIFLVCKIVKNGNMRMSSGGGGSTSVSAPAPAVNSNNSNVPEDAHALNVSTSSAGSNNINNPNHTLNNNTITPANNTLNNNISNGQQLLQSSTTDDGSVNQNRASMLLYNPSNGKESYRRPFGCAVLDISPSSESVSGGISSGGNNNINKDRTMPIFVPVNEYNFSTLHEDIIASRIKEFEKSPRAQYVTVGIKHFYGEAETIVKENPSLCQNAPLTARLGFPDVVFPNHSRNEVYLKLWSGNFDSSASSSASSGSGPTSRIQAMTPGTGAKNIEVSVEVRKRDGTLIENAISRGTGEAPVSHFVSMVFKSNSSPTWGELMKVNVDPAELLEESHMFFTFRQRTSNRNQPGPFDKPFAFGYLPLFPDNTGAFLQDGGHSLILYKYDRQLTSPQIYCQLAATSHPPSPSSSLLSGANVPPALAKLAAPLRDTAAIRTFLCSTQYTQNEVLLKLLRWETTLVNDITQLTTVLTKLRFCGEVEIVKFLRPIFDALFGILVSSCNHQGEVDDLVFSALVTVLGIVSDRRFNNFKPVLDVYFEHHFSCSPAWTHLLSSLHKMLADPTGADAQVLRASIKVWRWLFHIVVRSREVQRGKDVGMGVTSDHLESRFKQEVCGILTQINDLMGTTTPPSIIGTQTLVVQNFADILPDLSKCFQEYELADLAISFCDSIVATKGKIVIWKLSLLLQLVNGVLFDSPKSRAAFVPHLVRWIKPHLGRFDEFAHYTPKDPQSTRDSTRVAWLEGARLSLSVVAALFDRLHRCLLDPAIQTDTRNLLAQEHDNVEYALSLLPRLLDTYKELQNQANLESVLRHRSPTSMVVNSTPIAFPTMYPFSLVAPSLSSSAAANSSASDAASFSSTPNVNSPLSAHPHHNRISNIIGGAGTAADARSTISSAGSLSASSKTMTLELFLSEVAALIIIMLLLAPEKILTNFFDGALEVEGKENFARFLCHLCRVNISILNNEAFPKTWLNINILAHRVFLKLSLPLANILERDFIPQQAQAHTFNYTLWRDFFQMLLRLLASDQLVIEEFSPQKRRVVWRLAGDLRGEGAKTFIRLWDAIGWPEEESGVSGAVTRLGRYQVKFVPTLVEPLLELCLSHHDELRSTAVHVLYSMIVSEFSLDGNFSVIQNEVIDRLDKLFSQRKGDEISRAFFTNQLRALFDSSTIEETLRTQVDGFLDSVNEFLDLLLSVRNLPDGEEYQDDRVIGTLKLMTFIRGIGQSPIFLRYVHRLVDFHIASQNYTEAALSLKLHADIHDWNTTDFVDAMTEFDLPRQSCFARKENLYLRIIDLLAAGKSWELALDISKELQFQYENCVFDYKRNSELLAHQATMYDGIVSENRVYCPYFRVGFYGRGFPVALQNKQFVMCGYEWERLQSFCQRMQNKHPAATLLKTNTPPDEDLQFADGQYLQITTVVPEPERTLDVFQRPNVPAAVKHYYENNATKTFAFTRPIVKDGSGNAGTAESNSKTNIANLWTEKTILTCAEVFPTILRRSEIVEIQVVEISPVENAVIDVEKKTRELEELQRRYIVLVNTDRSTINTNPLSMALNGAVDAPVNGGIPMYRKAFLGNNYVLLNPDKTKAVKKLRECIDTQAVIIGKCLQLHGALCPSSMQPFHATLEDFFAKNFAEEIARLPASDFVAELPQIQRVESETAGSAKRASLDLSRKSFSGSTRPTTFGGLNGSVTHARQSISTWTANTNTNTLGNNINNGPGHQIPALSVHSAANSQSAATTPSTPTNRTVDQQNSNSPFSGVGSVVDSPTSQRTFAHHPSSSSTTNGSESASASLVNAPVSSSSLQPVKQNSAGSSSKHSSSSDRRSMLGRGLGSFRKWKKNNADE